MSDKNPKGGGSRNLVIAGAALSSIFVFVVAETTGDAILAAWTKEPEPFHELSSSRTRDRFESFQSDVGFKYSEVDCIVPSASDFNDFGDSLRVYRAKGSEEFITFFEIGSRKKLERISQLFGVPELPLEFSLSLEYTEFKTGPILTLIPERLADFSAETWPKMYYDPFGSKLFKELCIDTA
ncbi:hypothetical protein [Tateyamaria sp. SN3-11]|uniref:hypothetical protein n=1 Tax=Tateyamaria sp. SN3-11 TaxID=3092147 RepID=UPI0039E85590